MSESPRWMPDLAAIYNLTMRCMAKIPSTFLGILHAKKPSDERNPRPKIWIHLLAILKLQMFPELRCDLNSVDGYFLAGNSY